MNINIAETLDTIRENLKADRMASTTTEMTDAAYKAVRKAEKADLTDVEKSTFDGLAKAVINNYRYATNGTLTDLNRVEKILGFIALLIITELIGTGVILAICTIPGINNIYVSDAVFLTICGIWVLALAIASVTIAINRVAPWFAIKKANTRTKRMEAFLAQAATYTTATAATK